MTTATINRHSIMQRAWELTRDHMRFNRYIGYVMGRHLRQAWSEAKDRLSGIKPICDLKPAEVELGAIRARKGNAEVPS